MTGVAMLPMAQRQYGLDIVEPPRWPRDGGVRREPVYDRNFDPPRLVRHVGWRRCMACGCQFFSEDVQRQRLHPEGCVLQFR